MRFNKTFLWLILFFLFIFVINLAAFAQEKPKVAVLPFSMRESNDGYIGYYLRDLLKNAIDDTGLVEGVDSITVDEVLRDAKTPRDVALVQSMAQVLGKRMGCDYLLSGTYRIRQLGGQERLVVSARLFQMGKEGYVDFKSNLFDILSPDEFRNYFLPDIIKALGLDLTGSISPFSYDPNAVFPLYQGVEKMDEALRTYGDAQFPDKPLWKEAFTQVQKTIDSVPEYLDSYYYLAYMYQKTGWLAKEVETWTQYIELLKKSDGGQRTIPVAARAYLRLAYSYVSQKKYDMAIQSLSDALVLNPEFAEAYFLLGKVSYEKGDSSQAQEFWNKAYFLDPTLKQAQYFASEAGKAATYGKDAYESYRTGYTYYANGDLKTAEGYFRTAVKLNSEMKEAQYWLGRTLYDLGKLEEAEVTWKKVIEIDPFDSQAKRFLEKTIQERQYGRSALASFRKGYELYEEAKYEEAIPYFEKALRENPRYPDAHEYLARSYYLLGQKEKYLKEREKSVELLEQPADKAWQYYQIGYELFSWGEKAKAIDYLLKAVAVLPHFPEAHLLLGDLYGSLNQWAQSAEHYVRAKEGINGEDRASVLWGASVAFIQLERWDDAYEFLNELVRDYPYANFIEEAESLRIEAMVKKGLYRDARLGVQQFQLRFPSGRYRERVQFYYAFSFYQEKLWNEATKALEAFIKNYPQSQYQKEALEALGYAYRNLGQDEKSQTYFSQIEGGGNTFLIADTYYRQKDWQKAMTSFLNYLKTNPQGKYITEARLKLASCYLETNQIAPAEKIMTEIVASLDPKFTQDYLRLTIKVAYQKGDWKKVVDGVTQLQKEIGALDEEYLYLLAWSQVKLGNEEGARELLMKAGKDPDEILSDPEIEKIKEAADTLQKGNYSEAVKLLKEMISSGVKPENTSTVNFLYGKALYQSGDLNNAYDYLQKAITADGKEYLQEAYFYLGDIAYKNEKWSDVVKWYQYIYDPNNPDLLWRLAISLQKTGKTEQAVTIFKQLRGNATYAEKAGMIVLEELYNQKKYQDFLTEAKVFIAAYPNENQLEKILYMAIWAAYYSGKTAEALERIVEYNTQYPQGQYRDELESLSVDLMIIEKKYQAALPILTELEKKLSGEKLEYTWYRIGSVYLKMEKYDRAVFYFEKLLNNLQGKYFTRGGYLMGVCLEYLERPQEALKFYEQVVQSGKKDEWVDNAQKRISLLTEG